ncbi:MAG: DUF3782 domain-containing protein [Nitrospirae bacterium]|nr:DUF3782 domain-containing protein [Nitrospirota bacterium]MBF0592709.1 DUF3782 domain-containing protein [Nitrospirota bacterium]
MYASQERVDRIDDRIAEIAELIRSNAEQARRNDEAINQKFDKSLEELKQLKEEARLDREKAKLDREESRQLREEFRLEREKAELDREESRQLREEFRLDREKAELDREDFKQLREDSKRDREDFKNLEKLVAQTTASVNALTSKWSNFVEGLVFPATKRLFKERDIELDHISQRVKCHKSGAEMEIDILAVNGEYVVAIEIKSTLGVNDVKQHIERLAKFKQAFGEYANRIVIGAVAGIVIEEEADKYAYRNGLFVIAESGDTVRILNDDKFKPRHF